MKGDNLKAFGPSKKRKKKAQEKANGPDPDVYGGVGGALVASWKGDLQETDCCKLIVLPGVFTRMYLARQINEVIEKARREALEDAAKKIDEVAALWTSLDAKSKSPPSPGPAAKAIAAAIRLQARGEKL